MLFSQTVHPQINAASIPLLCHLSRFFLHPHLPYTYSSLFLSFSINLSVIRTGSRCPKCLLDCSYLRQNTYGIHLGVIDMEKGLTTTVPEGLTLKVMGAEEGYCGSERGGGGGGGVGYCPRACRSCHALWTNRNTGMLTGQRP